MESIKTGNFNDSIIETPQRRGWVLGQFIESQSLFHSTDVEIKWGVHKKGEKISTSKANVQAKSIAILLSGKININFTETNKSAVLENEGDFAIWNSGIFHNYEFIEDTTVITIRWPSIPNDVIKN
jgi:hypothetical protein